MGDSCQLHPNLVQKPISITIWEVHGQLLWIEWESQWFTALYSNSNRPVYHYNHLRLVATKTFNGTKTFPTFLSTCSVCIGKVVLSYFLRHASKQRVRSYIYSKQCCNVHRGILLTYIMLSLCCLLSFTLHCYSAVVAFLPSFYISDVYRPLQAVYSSLHIFFNTIEIYGLRMHV